MSQIASARSMPLRYRLYQVLTLPVVLAVSFFAEAQTQSPWDCIEADDRWACHPGLTETTQSQQPFDPSLPAPEQNSSSARQITQNRLDWIPRSALPDELAANCSRGCEGGYFAPMRDDAEQFIDPANAEMNAEMDLSELDGATGIVTLSGDVIFTQGWRQVAADHVVVDRNNYEMNGNITLREPNLLLTGESASVDAATGELLLNQSQYVLHDLRVQGGAEQIRRTENGRIFINNATYSTCEPVNESWRFVAQEIEIDAENARIIASDMQIKAGGLTLFYAPRISFPLGDNRKSGLLYPIFENSSANGLDIAQPIYLNLAPNYDLTLTPRFIEERGAMLESQFRWLSEASEGSLDIAYLVNDRGGADNNRRGDDRWFTQLLSSRQAFDGTLSLDYSAASDRDYFSDLGNASLQSSSQTWLDQSFSYQRQGQLIDFSLSAQSYQDLTRNELRGFNELPRIQLGSEWQSSSNLYLQSMQELVAFSPLNDSQLPGSALQTDQLGNWAEGERLRLDYRAGWRLDTSGSHLDTGVLLGYRQYQLNKPLAFSSDPSPDLFAGGLYVDTGLIFERSAKLVELNWIQTFEPRLQYLLVEADEQSTLPIFDSFEPHLTYDNIFRPNRFGGGDRIADANQITLGLETSMLSETTGREFIRMGVAQQFYLDRRDVHASPRLAAGLTDPSLFAADDPRRLIAETGSRELQNLLSKRSSLAGYAELLLPQNWYSRMMLNWSDREEEVDYGTFEFGYRAPASRSLVNLAYHYENAGLVFRDTNGDDLVQSGEAIDGTIEQLDISAVLEFSDNWTLVGKWQQDVTNSRPLEVMAGARYDACCWSTSLVWRHWLKRNDNLLLPEQALKHDNGIFVSFELKGLAGVGERLDNMLSGSIPGY